jgi:Fe-S-cluster containining protein
VKRNVTARPPLLKFRCTGCGNCCRDPLLPLTSADLHRIVNNSRIAAAEVISWVPCRDIDLTSGSENFASLRAGLRVMVMRRQRGGCRFLGSDDRCRIYSLRPLGCRIFPFDPDFGRNGKLVRLRMIDATECNCEMAGTNSIHDLRRLHQATELELAAYHTQVADWNRAQRRRRRRGQAALPATEYLRFLGFD